MYEHLKKQSFSLSLLTYTTTDTMLDMPIRLSNKLNNVQPPQTLRYNTMYM